MTRFVTCAAILFVCSISARADDKPAATKKPQIEVVFCLDTTGSMAGLIEGAKQKIWSISNQIASGKPLPELKIGLVAYRDRKDEYVTKVFELTDDLDAIHSQLRTFVAAGGGDTPESVNEALHDAVHKIKWSTDKNTLRLIFLVGDAPPHMDYPDDVKYPDTCKVAAERGIIINTVQCGAAADTQKVWQDICAKAEGSYVQIAQDGGVVAVATPFDKRLAEINAEITKTTLVFGCATDQKAGETKKEAALGLDADGAAARAAFNAKNARCAAYDLLDSIKSGKVKLEDLKKEELPPELQKLTLKEQKDFLAKVEQRRDELGKEAKDLDQKRAKFIADKIAADAKNKAKDGFDNQVLAILRVQCKRCGVEY